MVLCLKILPLGGSETDIPISEKTGFCFVFLVLRTDWLSSLCSATELHSWPSLTYFEVYFKFYFFIFIFIECLAWTLSLGTPCLVPAEARGQLNLFGLDLQMVISHFVGSDLNLGSLEEQPLILTAELSPQLMKSTFK